THIPVDLEPCCSLLRNYTHIEPLDCSAGNCRYKSYDVVVGVRLFATGLVLMHILRTMRTPRAIRLRTASDAARARRMRVRCVTGVSTPRSIRRRTTQHTECPRFHVNDDTRVDRGNAGQKTAMRNTRTYEPLSPLLPHASVARWRCTR